MSDMNCPDCQMWFHGYLDNELEAGEALRVRKHLSGCVDCQKQYRQMRQLIQGMREQLPLYQAPDALAARIMNSLQSHGTQRRDSVSRDFMRWLSGLNFFHILSPVVSFAALALAVFLFTSLPTPDDDITNEVVADHVRSLMAQHLTDVASSDKHTVKPWFIGKLDFTLPVFDFADRGYALLGGRMDYLESRTVAALVYQHNKHMINLFVMPTSQVDNAMEHATKRGYNVVSWRKNHMRFIAISDMNMDDLAGFGQMFQTSQ